MIWMCVCVIPMVTLTLLLSHYVSPLLFPSFPHFHKLFRICVWKQNTKKHALSPHKQKRNDAIKQNSKAKQQQRSCSCVYSCCCSSSPTLHTSPTSPPPFHITHFPPLPSFSHPETLRLDSPSTISAAHAICSSVAFRAPVETVVNTLNKCE